jgi:hypothetical protein
VFPYIIFLSTKGVQVPCPVHNACPHYIRSMDYLEKADVFLDIEIFELKRMRERLGENFSRAVELIKEAVDARGKVVVVGVR